MTTKVIINFKTRLRVRRVNESHIVDKARARAKELGGAIIFTGNGGGVCNSYGYRAETEAYLAVGFPNGDVFVEVNRIPANKVTLRGSAASATPWAGIPANKVTLRGSAASATPWAGILFDARYKRPQARLEARQKTLAYAMEHIYPDQPEPKAPLLDWEGFPLG